jgi:hypothetical protein
MPSTFIESTNISFSSLNTLKNTLETTSATTANTSLNALRNWFRDRVGNTGNFTHTGANNTDINISQFSERFIYGFYAGGFSESIDNRYYDNNDGGVTFWWAWGDNNANQFAFYLAGRGWVTPNANGGTNTGTAFHSLSGAFNASNTSTNYQCYVQHRGATSRVGFTIRIGYGGGGTFLIRNNGAATDIRTTAKFFPVDKNF